MLVTIHQPAYMPWLGYLDRIQKADIFIFLDSVQFEKNSFINRNKIKAPSGPQWLTVPVKTKGHTKSSISDVSIDNNQQWRRKHLSTIQANYSRAPFYKLLAPQLESLFSADETMIADLCWNQLHFWLSQFSIKVKLVRSSTLQLTSRNSDLILDICKLVGAKRYLSGPFGKSYLDEKAFENASIEIEYATYQFRPYPQLWGGYIPGLSCLDFWMNSGPNSAI